MNERQRSTIRSFVLVISLTAMFVLVMVNVKDAINKSEGIIAMEKLAESVLAYRKDFGSTPPESFIVRQQKEMQFARLGTVIYRAQWIGFNDDPNTILAYAFRDFQFLVKCGYVVMWLDGSVGWMGKKDFEELLASQQKKAEVELLHGRSKR